MALVTTGCWELKFSNSITRPSAVAIKHGIRDHYDSISGKRLGVRDYCISSTLASP